MLVRVRGRSMVPALRPGSWIWISPRATIGRGDIVLIQKKDLLVKRVIGLPKENVQLRSGQVFIDGVAYPEPYLSPETYLEPQRDASWLLAEDEFLVLGDARDDSLDSRRLGPVHRQEVKGVMTRRLWPWRKR